MEKGIKEDYEFVDNLNEENKECEETQACEEDQDYVLV